MQNFLKAIILTLDLLGLVLFAAAFFGLKKIVKAGDKLNEDDFLTEIEMQKYYKYNMFMLVGFSVSVITSAIKLILLFLN